MKKGLMISMMVVWIAGFGCASAPPENDESGKIRKNSDRSNQSLEEEESNHHDESERDGY